ncbi:insulin-like growth factor-binding protein complex acid labile subunit [Tribolium castaneum]|nr:PREDICTED: insulin-like growth factor-binding protein complex acid labile subunit [Tribolium castaneum]|eukprot:XP_008201327.1 PREDICTED: insulin-like growth factor-binding protein complex acid labile subunit [Tribolium castaneum]
MKSVFCTTFFLIVLIKESIPLCVVVKIGPPRPNYGYWPTTEAIQCRNEVISSDLAEKVLKLTEMHPSHSLEIIDGNNPEIPADGFKLLRSLPALRINNASVRTIQPGAFNGLRYLKQLSLKYNRIEVLNENCFENLTMLTDLDLSFNKIVSIHSKSFANLTRLRVLFLQNNLIAELPPDLFRDQNYWLRVVDLSFNKLLTVKKQLLFDLTDLYTIYLNNNRINHLESDVFNTKKLKHIHIDNNELQSLTNLTLPNTVELLNVSHNLIKSMSFSKYVVISLLDLSANGLASANGLKLENATIKQLNLDQNNFGTYPSVNQTAFFSNLIALETLSLSNNNLQQLSRNSFTHNQHLTKLNLTGNSLRNGDFLNFLPNLQYLNVSFNNFDSNTNLSVLISLKNLDFSFNSLDQIRYNFLGGLKFLQTLNLSHNKISKISIGCFRDLQMLYILDLSNNEISSLELGVFGGLTRLSELDLSHNGLIQLNEGTFHNFKYLHVLNLRKTGLSYTVVENIMSHFPGLINIDLAENNWSCTLLIKFVKKHASVRLLGGRDYNTANVHGVACNDQVEDTTELVNTSENFPDFRVTNTLLIFILIVLIVQLASKHISVFWKRKKGQKQESDQELRLVSEC